MLSFRASTEIRRRKPRHEGCAPVRQERGAAGTADQRSNGVSSGTFGRLAARARAAGRGFARARDGVAAIEFAILAPVLITLLGGATDLSGAVTTGNRATYVAEGIAQMVSQVKGPINQTTMAEFIKTAPMLDADILNYARLTGTTDLTRAVSVVVSSVVFKPTVSGCIKNCTYEAYTVFSTTLGGWTTRPCGKLSPGTSGMATLPAEAFSASSLVVVDVEMFYRPLMSMFLPATISFKRTALFRPRNVEHVNYKDNCVGYPVT